MKFKRVLLKISGEALMGSLEFGVDPKASLEIANKIREFKESGGEIAIVIGGGNIFRGIKAASWAIERTPADQIGMLATLMNGIVLKQTLVGLGLSARMLTALDCPTVAEKYQWDSAMAYLKKGEILLFVGGTGHPYFTTDTTAALRANEIHADIFLKATTRVDGIYDKDPRQHKDAQKFETITYQEILEKRLGILDLSAVTLCMESKLPIRVFNLYQGSLLDAISENKSFGTLVRG